MHSISDLQSLIQKEIDSLELKSTPADLYEPVRYILSLGGKRMRPVLVLLSCQLFGGNIKAALKPALGLELFHNFTLLHDDIMDNAPMRRNKATVHEKWNPNVAILSGDAMYTIAMKLMLHVEHNLLDHVLELFTDTALLVCEGQQLDMDFEKASNVKIDDYLHMIELKTAVLVACCLKTGALIAHASKEQANHIYNFGKNLGIAFQLQDDLLDVFGDTSKVGKQPGGDIIANKKTYLLLKAMELANFDQYDELMQLMNNKNNRYEPWEKVQHVTSIFTSLGIRELTETKVYEYYKNAIDHLNMLQLPQENKKVLYDFAAQLMSRQL